MLRIPHACDRLGGIRHLLDSGLEEFFGRLEKFRPFAEGSLTEQRSTNLKHQLDVVRVPEFECSTEAAKRGVILPELEQCFAKPGKSVFVFRLEHERLLERAAGPREFLPRELCIPNPHVQLYRIRIENESLSKYGERIVILALVVELMRALVILFRTQERGGHLQQASGS